MPNQLSKDIVLKLLFYRIDLYMFVRELAVQSGVMDSA